MQPPTDPAVVAARDTTGEAHAQGERGEIRFVALFAAALAALTSVPYVLAQAFPPESWEGWRFDGQLVFDEDFNAYLAFVGQALRGSWLFHNPFTPEPHGEALFNLEWLALGKLAALTGASVETMMQAERILAIFVLCGALHWLCTFSFRTRLVRRAVFCMTLLGGGFGWLAVLPGLREVLPAEAFLDGSAGFHPFFWMLLQPHFAMAQALAVLALGLLLRAERTGRASHFVLAGALCALLGTTRPFDMLFLCTATTLYAAVLAATRRDGLQRFLLRLSCAFCSLPVLVYYLWLFRAHPVFRWWNLQNNLPPPMPSALFLSLGFAALLFLAGLGNLGHFRGRALPAVLAGCCALASLGLLYSYPFLSSSMQVSTSVLIPIVLVGTLGLEGTALSLVERRSWGRAALVAFLALNSLTSVRLWWSQIAAVRAGEHRTDARALALYRWIDEHSAPREVVLANYDHSNRIPRYTENDVYCGYVFSTVEFARKNELAQTFFRAQANDAFRRRVLEQGRVRYVLFDLRERGPSAYAPQGSPMLREVFRNEIGALYEVVR